MEVGMSANHVRIEDISNNQSYVKFPQQPTRSQGFTATKSSTIVCVDIGYNFTYQFVKRMNGTAGSG